MARSCPEASAKHGKAAGALRRFVGGPVRSTMTMGTAAPEVGEHDAVSDEGLCTDVVLRSKPRDRP